MHRKHKGFQIPWKLIILIGIVALGIFMVKPWFHDIAMYFYTNPIVIEVIIIWFVLHKFVLSRGKKKKITIVTENGKEQEIAQVNFMSYFFLFVLFIAAGWMSGILPDLHVINEIDYTTIEMLPETTEDARLMPFEVAQRFSKDSLQLSQFRLGSENIAMVNGSLSWSFPLVPDGGILTFILKNKGVVYVDATTQDRTSNIVFEDLSIGEGMQVTDNLFWAVYNKKYFIDLDDPYYTVSKDGKIYTVISFVSYTFHQNFGLVYTVPRYGGVLLIDSAGNIESLTPEAALENEILEGNRLYPENLARYYIETFQFKKGVINRFFIHEDQIDIRDVSFRNRQPFLMDTKEGLKWFISAEPASASRGIFKIFLVDARTGAIEVKEIAQDETLTGPIRSRDFVRRSNPLVDWAVFRIVEPLPFVIDDVLYWKVVIVPVDAAGIAFQAFVNSETNEVVNAETDGDVKSFLMNVKVEEKTEEVKVIKGTREDVVSELKKKFSEIEVLIGRL